MNWRVSALDRYTLVSNSDAHSPAKLGREANVFACEMGYAAMMAALAARDAGGFWGTLEFFPEEGKYHSTATASAIFAARRRKAGRCVGAARFAAGR